MSESTTSITAVIGRDRFRTEVHADEHVFIADEPIDAGGQALGPEPYQWLLTALGTCTVMTLRSYADMKQLPVDRIQAVVSMRVEDRDGIRHTAIYREISIEGNIEEDLRHRMLKVAERCPVHKVLSGDIHISSELTPI